MPSLLESIAFREPARARRELASLASDFSSQIHNQIEILLAAAPDPDRAVHYLTSLKQQHPGAFVRLSRTPATLHYLITVFAYSHFLSDEILQNPQWIEQLGDMDRVLAPEDYAERLVEFLGQDAEGAPPP